MPAATDTIKSLFFAALEKAPGERSTFLDSACGGDADLRQRLDALLAAYRESDPLLDCPAGWQLEPDSPSQAEGGDTPLPDTPLGPEALLHAPGLSRAGRFRLLGEIARGGMGTVLRAHDPALDRPLAVKVILPQHRADPSLVRRFLDEARLAGQLQHPGVVPVLDVGQLEDGRPFFAMKLVEGQTLAELLRQRPDPGQDLPRLLRYFEAVCQAVGYAHSRGVIHRDLKPANVMVGAFGEVQVMDWGIAKGLAPLTPTLSQPRGEGEKETPAPPSCILGEQGEGTRAGAVVGTPGYMAPEQARGEAVTRRGDVFALGAMLCEVLTGSPPFAAEGGASPGLLDVLARVRQADLRGALARLDRCGADPELVRLARECLSPRPEDRPADGAAVAERVAAHLAGLQDRLSRAEARAEGERTRRRLALGLAVAVLALVALGGSALLLVQRSQAEQAREQARRQQAGESALARSADLRQQGRWDEALAVLEQARQRLDERDGQLSRDVLQAVEEAELIRRLEQVRLRAATWTGRSFAVARADREYEAEFRAAGLGGPGEPADAVAERVRASGVRAALVAALDAWAVQTENLRRRDWVRAVARRADQGGAWGRRLRASWADFPALERLAREAPIDRLSPHLLVALAGSLSNSREAVPLLRRAQARYPGDFWVTFSLAARLHVEQRHAEAAGFYQAALAVRPGTPAVLINLGTVLTAQKQLDEACDCFRRATALAPGLAHAHYNLGHALQAKDRLDAAVASYQKATALDPKYAEAHCNLGVVLQAQGRLDAAIARYRKACEANPKLALAHHYLGLALKDKGDLTGAIASFTKASVLDPRNARAHHNLGVVLKDKGDLERAIASSRRAIAIDPQYANAHYALGVALDARKDVEGAIACYKRAITLDPRHAQAHNNLGELFFRARDQRDAAIACYRKAITLDPTLVQAWYNLGSAWLAAMDWDRAVACFRKAIALDPRHAESHCNLGYALLQRGDFGEALGPFRRGHALGSKRRDWKYDSGAWVRDCQRMVEREKKLLAVLAGKTRAAGARELAGYADLCAWTRRYAAAARLWGEAFEAEAKLADDVKAGRRYQAATAAALAAAGKGRDAGGLEGARKEELRKKALAWLKADLAARAKQPAGERVAALRRWLADKALAGVRGEEALRALPEAERASWSTFWAEVRRHLSAGASSPY
jgi:tetratricopeptide (TPR) repeat protein